MRIDLVQVERTVSTNADVRRAIEDGVPEGHAVLAREQTGGYGRRGNSWASAPGGMYLSLLLRPTRALEDWPTLSLLAAVAVLRAVARVAPEAAGMVRIKAPNDVIVGDNLECPRKLAGILPEAHAGGVALGIGVNLTRPAREPALDGRNVPVYLNELVEDAAVAVRRARSDDAGDARTVRPSPTAPEGRIDAPAFAAVLLESFGACYATWRNKGFDPFAAEYEAVASRRETESHATENEFAFGYGG